MFSVKKLLKGILTPLTYITFHEHAVWWPVIMMYTDGATLVPVSSLSVQCWGQEGLAVYGVPSPIAVTQRG